MHLPVDWYRTIWPGLYATTLFVGRYREPDSDQVQIEVLMNNYNLTTSQARHELSSPDCRASFYFEFDVAYCYCRRMQGNRDVWVINPALVIHLSDPQHNAFVGCVANRSYARETMGRAIRCPVNSSVLPLWN